jgi:hypothetical protein
MWQHLLFAHGDITHIGPMIAPLMAITVRIGLSAVYLSVPARGLQDGMEHLGVGDGDIRGADGDGITLIGATDTVTDSAIHAGMETATFEDLIMAIAMAGPGEQRSPA